MPKKEDLVLNIAFVSIRMATVSTAIFQSRNFKYCRFSGAYCYFPILAFFSAAFFQHWHFYDHFAVFPAFKQNFATRPNLAQIV